MSYVLNYVFRDRLGLDYQLIDDTHPSYTTAHFSYSNNSESHPFQILPHGILNDEDIRENAYSESLLHPYLNTNRIVEPFAYPDIFAAIFYHISRYEEYLSAPDQHGRFKFEDSCLYQNSLLLTPVVDIWMDQFKNDLIDRCGFKESDFKKQTYSTVCTLDIDSVFTYKGKGLLRTLAALSKDLIFFNFIEIKKRLSVLFLKAKDPNDVFDELLDQLQTKKALFFIQVGKYGRFDKNLAPSHKGFRKIIQELDKSGHELGLHPSYQSDSNAAIIKEEKTTLEGILKKELSHSRQHFLRFSLPKTFRALLSIGIEKEYSMGYSEHPGFRAGTAMPFKWFDLENNSSTELEVHPFVVMDVAYKHFQNMDIEKTIEASGEIKDICSTLNLPFVFVFHNESLSGHRGWENWYQVFKFWNHA
ncbi:MAG: polysaccharide deacetylase family protein [Bacteroidia bacterium]